MMKGKYAAFIFVFLALACKQQDNSVSKSISSAEVNIPIVEIINPGIKSFESDIAITGSVKPDKMVKLHAMEEGYLQKIYVDIGDYVRSGQAIAQLANPILDYEVKMAEVKIKEAQAKLKASEIEVKRAQKESEIKSSIYQRLKSIYDKSKGLTTITELDNAMKESEMAVAQAESALANIEVKKAEIEAVESLKSAVAARKSMLTVRAPFSGIVTGRFVDQGAMIQSAIKSNSAIPIISLEAMNPARLSFPLPESDIEGIGVGNIVNIHFPVLGDKTITAKISRLSRTLDPLSKTMEVQIDLPNKDGVIKSGMYAKVIISRSSSVDKLSLPNAAILMRKDAPFVMLVEDGIVVEKALSKGISGKDYFEVLNSDIGRDSQVILKGKSSVKQGQKVNAVMKSNEN